MILKPTARGLFAPLAAVDLSAGFTVDSAGGDFSGQYWVYWVDYSAFVAFGAGIRSHLVIAGVRGCRREFFGFGRYDGPYFIGPATIASWGDNRLVGCTGLFVAAATRALLSFGQIHRPLFGFQLDDGDSIQPRQMVGGQYGFYRAV